MNEAMVPNFKRSAVKRKIVQSLALLIYLIFAPSVHAGSVSLSVSPPVVEVLISPNKKATQTFTLKTTGENIDVTPELHLAKPTDANGHVEIDPAPLNPSSLPLTINITGPNNMPTLTFEAANVDMAQDIYLALVFRSVGAQFIAPSSSSSTSLSPAISALILVTINPSGVIPIGLEVKDFSLPFFHDSWLPLTINPVLENKVGVMIRPQGKYEIIDPSGKTILDLPLYPNLILGNSSRRILGSHTRCVGSLHTGCVDSALDHTPLTFSPTWSNFGPHRLRLTITTEGGTKITEIEKVVWLLPIRTGIIIILFIILFIIFLSTRKSSTPPTLSC